MHGLLRLVACLALTACADPKTPEDDSDSGSSTAPTAGTTVTPDDPTTAGPTTADSTTGTPTTGDSTTGDGVPGVHAGACKPVDGNTCPTGHTCCSDDPAALGALPNYFNPDVVDDQFGPPLFSAENNDLSHWGYCIETGGFPSPLSNGCPVPCDPHWNLEERVLICGGSQCCPFTAVDVNKDCILDPDTGRWRTVNGSDVLLKRSEWGDAHATNQDPQLESCKQLAAGDENAMIDCVRKLAVADRRGYCFSGECPCVEDVCAQKNPDYVPRCQ
ncbi:hypothetical protein [Nannocystis pusilla]|uniref:hypothetical protein n=1 Tax=Nannocystis pusilla TaxID=889268 RepID=UPI003B82456A